jgi:hypothetical protein
VHILDTAGQKTTDQVRDWNGKVASRSGEMEEPELRHRPCSKLAHAEKSARSNGPFFRSLHLRHHAEDEKAIHKSARKRRGFGRALLQ